MMISHHHDYNGALKMAQNRPMSINVSTKSIPSSRFGGGPGSGPTQGEVRRLILGVLTCFTLAGAGVGYTISQFMGKKEPDTIQTPVKTTADDIQSLQQQLDAKKAQLEQERKDLEAKLKAVQEAEKQLKQ